MSNKHLSLEPYTIDSNTWIYEGPDGLSLYLEVQDKSRNQWVELKIIPWRKIRAALKRKDRKDDK